MSKQNLILPVKILWRIDLTQSIESRWSPSVLQKLKKGRYEQEIAWEVLSSEHILSDFLPIYQENVMSRSDFYLNSAYALTKIKKMAADPTYKLFWFTSKVDHSVYGGTIIHPLTDIVMVAFRAFDHGLAKAKNLRSLDYYADHVLQRYVKSMGIAQLSRGFMKHPDHRLGLSVYKLSTGARPRILVKDEVLKSFSQEDVAMLAREHGTLLYYSDPDQRGYFRKAVVFAKDESEDFLAFVKLANRSGIEVSRIVL